MGLQDLVDVAAGDLQGDEHLDHELVARGRHELRRRAQPLVQLARAGCRDAVSLLRSLGFSVVGLDEPVTFEALERRVDLPDVEWPHLARPRLELALEAQAVLRAFAEEREQGIGDAHEQLQALYILSSIPGIPSERKRHGPLVLGHLRRDGDGDPSGVAIRPTVMAGIDLAGHGTHVASFVAAPISGIGIAGVAPEATIVALNACTVTGYCFVDPVVAALRYAGDQRLDIVIMSFFADPFLYYCTNDAGRRSVPKS